VAMVRIISSFHFCFQPIFTASQAFHLHLQPSFACQNLDSDLYLSHEWNTAIYYPGQTIDVIVYLRGSSGQKSYCIRKGRHMVRYPWASTPSVIIAVRHSQTRAVHRIDLSGRRSRGIMAIQSHHPGPYKIMGAMKRINSALNSAGSPWETMEQPVALSPILQNTFPQAPRPQIEGRTPYEP
jgi:hypothetical protein